MKPGIYRLSQPVTNPNKGDFKIDRRAKHDWRVAPTWEYGAEFVVEVIRNRAAEKMLADAGQPVPAEGILETIVCAVGTSQHVSNLYGKHIFQALEAALTPSNNPPIDAWVKTNRVTDTTMAAILMRLVYNGVVSLEAVQEEFTKYMEE